MATTINLTVNSVNNANVTAFSHIFVVANLRGVTDNLNEASAVTITKSGDTNSVLSDFALYGKIYDAQILYWSLETVTGTTRKVNIYSNSSKTRMVATGTATIANGNAGSIFFNEYEESGIYGSVTLTIGGGGLTDDTDTGNTLVLSNVKKESNFQIAGKSQFMYLEGIQRFVKYTVTQTPAEIQALTDES